MLRAGYARGQKRQKENREMPFEYKPHWPHDPKPDPKRCKASVSTHDRAALSYQCSRKPWKDGWCKQHHPDSEKARLEEVRRRSEEKWANSPAARTRREIERLQNINAELRTACEALLDAAYDTLASGVPCVTLESAIELGKNAIAKAKGE